LLKGVAREDRSERFVGIELWRLPYLHGRNKVGSTFALP